jgi:CBS domain-containing protein
MKVQEVMSKNVATVDSNTSLVDVAKIMYKMNVGSLPVVEGNKVIGIVTDRDIVLRDIAQGKNPQNSKVKDVMTSGLSTASPDMDIHDAARLMAEKQIRRLPVVENESLVGMLAIGDIAVRSKLEDDAGMALSDISIPTGTH